MNQDMTKGLWKQVKGSIKNKWGRLTDDEILALKGDKDMLAGKIQEKYGIGRREAITQVEDFQASMEEARKSDETSS